MAETTAQTPTPKSPGEDRAPPAPVTRSEKARKIGAFALRLGFELVVVFSGVTAAFLVDDLRTGREEARRMRQFSTALAEELEAFASFGQQMHDAMAAGWREWEEARQAGERPVPYYYVLPEFEGPPMDAWEATLASGGINLFDTRLFINLAVHYGRVRTLVERYQRLTAFVEANIRPREGEGPDVFYLPGGNHLRPEYAAYLERRLTVQREFQATLESARAVLAEVNRRK